MPIADEFGQPIVRVPKIAEKERFQTWQQIERRIKRGSLENDESVQLWQSLFLDAGQVSDLLSHVKSHAIDPFVYPMFAFIAYTGARKSEVLRSQVEDFDFEQRLVRIREKKRRKDLASSTRFVPINQHLVEIMQEWFDEHPGGQFTLTKGEGRRVGTDLAHKDFKKPLLDSKWSVVRGFHVLRHSFGANLARTGKIPSETIGRWMGHSTDDMRTLYQHLFPQDGPKLIDMLSYD